MELTVKSQKLLAVTQLASHCCDPLSLSQALLSIAIRVALIVLVMAMVGCVPAERCAAADFAATSSHASTAACTTSCSSPTTRSP